MKTLAWFSRAQRTRSIEAILAVAGHEVDMDVGDALADVIVDGDERPIGG